jgi:hypothetical protein
MQRKRGRGGALQDEAAALTGIAVVCADVARRRVGWIEPTAVVSQTKDRICPSDIRRCRTGNQPDNGGGDQAR